MAGLGVPPTIEIASIGIPDTLLLMLLALVVFGPRRLPEIGRQIGKLMYEFRKVSNDFKFQMEEELRASEEADRQKKLQAAQQAALAAPATPVVEPKPVEVLEPGVGTTIIDPTYSAALAAEGAAATGATMAELAPPVEGEVRGEARRGPQIQPPATGETVAAQKPFRGRLPDVTAESNDEAAEASPAGQPESQAGAEQEAHHA
jgi:sec-independent protein translocase protein TatB